MSITKTGDWAKARRLLSAGPQQLKRGIAVALRQEAQNLRTEIVQGLTRQSPGGEPLKALSPLTLATRKMLGFGGSKALIVRADLRNAVTAHVRGDEAFVGIPRKARSRDGKSVADIAKVHEFGSDPVVIPMTAAMRRFVFAMLRTAGIPPRKGAGRGVVVTQIPARPFLRPAFKKFSRGAQKRFLGRVSRVMGMGG